MPYKGGPFLVTEAAPTNMLFCRGTPCGCPILFRSGERATLRNAITLRLVHT